jgi:hypothetical protein
VDTLGEAGGFFDGEAGNEQRGLEEKLSDGFDSAVILAISFNLLLELINDGGFRRDFKRLLGRYVRGYGGVTESLSLHDALHVGRPAELTGTDGARRTDKLVRDDDLLDLVAKDVLEAFLSCGLHSRVSTWPQVPVASSFLPSVDGIRRLK